MNRWLPSVMLLVACADAYEPAGGVATLDDAVQDDFIAVTAGKEHSCALISDGSAYCWGSNETGQLGVEQGEQTCTREDRHIPCEPRPVAVGGGLKFQSIAAGASHTCGVTLEGRVFCWGDNLWGQLGDPSVRMSDAPIAALSADEFVDVTAGGYHTCALRTDGVVLCWGANLDGQLGQASIGNGSAVPTPTNTSVRFSSVSAGDRRTCGRVSDGAVFCWGAMWTARQDGVDVTRPEGSPSRLLQAPAIRAISVGTSTTCGISADNGGYCWEGNATGTLGNGTTAGSVTPTLVKIDKALVAISVGFAHACAIAATGRVYCWGANDFGQLGVSPSLLNYRCAAGPVCTAQPIEVSGWRLYRDISAGQGNHTCALTLGGSVYCWGAGGLGQLGVGHLSNEWAAERVRRPDEPLM